MSFPFNRKDNYTDGQTQQNRRARERQRNTTSDVGGSPSQDPTSAVSKAWKQVNDDFKHNGVDTANIGDWMAKFVFQDLGWGGEAVLDSLVRGYGILIPDEEIGRIFRLREFKYADRNTQPSGKNTFYMRTFKMTAAELRDLVIGWSDDLDGGCGYDEMWRWMRVSANLEGNDHVYIRYIGQVGNNRNAYMRYLEDMERTGGLYGQFIEQQERQNPEIVGRHDRVRIHEFCNLIFDRPTSVLPHPHLLGQTQYDAIERILIAIFGFSTLLNRQIGGYYGSYQASIQDEKLFTACKTNLFEVLTHHAGPSDHRLRPWADKIAKFINENPFMRRTVPLTEQWHDLVIKQATPRLVRGYTLFVCVGKDITRESFLANEPFFGKHPNWNPQSRSGSISVSFLRTLAKVESGFDHPPTIPQGMFPFVDIWPYIEHPKECEMEMVELVQWYITKVQPLIIVTFSKLAASYVAANFLHGQGLPFTANRYIDHVGIPRIQFYDTEWVANEDAEYPDPDSAFIQIAHYDPGVDKYGSQLEELRRLMLLTWMVTFLIGSRVQQALPIRQEVTRNQFLNDVVDTLKETSEYKELVDKLSACKEKLYEHWRQKEEYQRKTLKSSSKNIAEAAVRRAYRCGIAIGAPRSDVRNTQVQILWKTNYPAFHIKEGLRHTSADKERWFAWALNVAEGKSYAMSMMAGKAKSVAEYVKWSELSLIADKKALENEAKLKEFFGDLVRAGEALGDWRSSTDNRYRAIVGRYGSTLEKWIDYQFAPDIDGKRVYMRQNGKIPVFWADDSHDARVHRTIILTAPRKLWPERLERWTIHITPTGFELRRNGSHAHDWKIATLCHSEQGEIVKACWEQHSGTTVLSLASAASIPSFQSAATSSDPQYDFSGPRLRPLLKGESANNSYHRPPIPSEGTWIAYMFFEEKYHQQAGTFFIYGQAHLVDKWKNKEVGAQLLKFLRESRFDNYPWKNEWEFILDPATRGKGGTEKMIQNLTFCRQLVKGRNEQAAGGKKGWYWTFDAKYNWE